MASFATASSVVLGNATQATVSVTFTRPITGALRYLAGGTAVPGVDFVPLSGELAVSGDTADLTVQLLPTPFLESERRLVLTLSHSAGNPPPYVLGATQVHELRIIEGDQGVYFGALAITNGFLLGAQPVRVALRSGAGAGKAYFDTSQSSFFKEPFETPVQFGGNGKPFEFTGGANGSVQSETLQRRLDWVLQFAPVLPGTNNHLTAKFSLEVSGLSGSGKRFTAEGLLQLNRADN